MYIATPLYVTFYSSLVLIGISGWIDGYTIRKKTSKKWPWIVEGIISLFDILIGGINIWIGLKIGIIGVVFILLGSILVFIAIWLLIKFFKCKYKTGSWLFTFETQSKAEKDSINSPFSKPIRWIGNQWICTQCEKTNPSNVLFCEFCGYSRQKQVYPTVSNTLNTIKRSCPVCKNTCETGDCFCVACGAALAQTVSEITPLQQSNANSQNSMLPNQCVYCGHKNEYEDHFCTRCGKEIHIIPKNTAEAISSKSYIFCAECGTRCSEDLSFCNTCGSKLTRTANQGENHG